VTNSPSLLANAIRPFTRTHKAAAPVVKTPEDPLKLPPYPPLKDTLAWTAPVGTAAGLLLEKAHQIASPVATQGFHWFNHAAPAHNGLATAGTYALAAGLGALFTGGIGALMHQVFASDHDKAQTQLSELNEKLTDHVDAEDVGKQLKKLEKQKDLKTDREKIAELQAELA
jgi:hypothetical protein